MKRSVVIVPCGTLATRRDKMSNKIYAIQFKNSKECEAVEHYNRWIEAFPTFEVVECITNVFSPTETILTVYYRDWDISEDCADTWIPSEGDLVVITDNSILAPNYNVGEVAQITSYSEFSRTIRVMMSTGVPQHLSVEHCRLATLDEIRNSWADSIRNPHTKFKTGNIVTVDGKATNIAVILEVVSKNETQTVYNIMYVQGEVTHVISENRLKFATYTEIMSLPESELLNLRGILMTKAL